MSVRTEPIDKWVRAYVDDVAGRGQPGAAAGSEEEEFPVPSYAFAPKRRPHRRCSPRPGSRRRASRYIIFLPHGPVARWFDLTVGARTLSHAAWVRDTPELEDRLVLSWTATACSTPGWRRRSRWPGTRGTRRSASGTAITSSRHVEIVEVGVRPARGQHLRPVTGCSRRPTRYYLASRRRRPHGLGRRRTPALSLQGRRGPHWSVPAPRGGRRALVVLRTEAGGRHGGGPAGVLQRARRHHRRRRPAAAARGHPSPGRPTGRPRDRAASVGLTLPSPSTHRGDPVGLFFPSVDPSWLEVAR